MYVGVEGCVVGEWGEAIQFSLVKLGICSVWGQVAVCEPELIERDVRGNWDVTAAKLDVAAVVEAAVAA